MINSSQMKEKSMKKYLEIVDIVGREIIDSRGTLL